MKVRLIILLLLLSATNFVFGQKNAQPFEQGDLRLDLKLPHFNYLDLFPNREFRDAEIGFNGYGLGLEYSYKDDKFVEIGISLATTFELPIPVPLDAEYNKILSSTYVNLTDNFIKNRFTFGYGVNLSHNIRNEWTRDFSTDIMNFDSIGVTTSSQIHRNLNLGLTFNTYYRLGKTVHLGLIYQPSFVPLRGDPAIIYEHLISLEINWRIKLLESASK